MPESAADKSCAKAFTDLAYWRNRQDWSDAHIISDFCNQFRAQARNQADMIERAMAAVDAPRTERWIT